MRAEDERRFEIGKCVLAFDIHLRRMHSLQRSPKVTAPEGLDFSESGLPDFSHDTGDIYLSMSEEVFRRLSGITASEDTFF